MSIYYISCPSLNTVSCIRPRPKYRRVNCTANAVAQCMSNESHFYTSRVGRITFILVSARDSCFRNRSLIHCLKSDVYNIVSCSSSECNVSKKQDLDAECLETVTSTALSTTCSKRPNERRCVSIIACVGANECLLIDVYVCACVMQSRTLVLYHTAIQLKLLKYF